MARSACIGVISQPPLFCPYSPDHEAQLRRMLDHLRGWLEFVLPDSPDLIVTPGMTDSFRDYSYKQLLSFFRYRGELIRDFYAGIAREYRCCIAYSGIRCLDDDSDLPYRNSTRILDRNGQLVGIYDQNHLLPGETELYGRGYGTETPVFELDFGRVCCAICFDLNFPELMWRYAALKPDLILFQSMFNGGFIQQQWAYHCRAYLASAVCDERYNDGSGAHGVSRILDPLGQTLATTTDHVKTATAVVNFDRFPVHFDNNREALLEAKRKYGRSLQCTEPGQLGSCLLTYAGTDTTAEAIAREFGIVGLDDYFAACRTHRAQALR